MQGARDGSGVKSCAVAVTCAKCEALASIRIGACGKQKPGRASIWCAKGKEGLREGLELRKNAKIEGVRARGSSMCLSHLLHVGRVSACDLCARDLVTWFSRRTHFSAVP